MSRSSNLERFIRGAVAFQVLTAVADVPSLDTATGISTDGEKIEPASVRRAEGPAKPTAAAPVKSES